MGLDTSARTAHSCPSRLSSPHPVPCWWQGSGLSGSPAASSVFHFRAGHHWWWVPLTAPILGSLAGVLIHKLFIDFHNQPVLESGNEKGQPVVETSTL